MNWLDTLLKKLPTLKGIAHFLYVATHWQAITEQQEQYRKQIADRDSWLRSQEENLKKLSEQERIKITAEYEEKLRTSQHAVEQFIGIYFEAVGRLAVKYEFDPLLWELEYPRMNPLLAENIRVLMKLVPEPPPPPQFGTLGDLFTRPSNEHDNID